MQTYIITLKTKNTLYGYNLFLDFYAILKEFGIGFVVQGTYNDFKIAYCGDKSIKELFEGLKCQK